MPDTIDTILFTALKTSAPSITWWSALSSVLVAIVIGSIVSLSISYLEAHSRDDHRTTKGFVLLNTAFVLGQLGMNMWQTHQLFVFAGTDFASVLPFDVKADMVCVFATGYHNLCAAAFFAWRAWRLSGKKWYILPILVTGVTASFALCLATLVHGIGIPAMVITNLVPLLEWNDSLTNLVTAWTSVSVGTDTLICSLMMFLLLRTKAKLSFSDLPIVRRILFLVFECMIPPTIAVIAMLVTVVLYGATDANMSRVLSWMVGPLYFQAMLIALIGRGRIRKGVSGVRFTSGAHSSGRDASVPPNGGVHVSVSRLTAVTGSIHDAGTGLVYDGHAQMGEIPLESMESKQSLV